MLYNNGDQFNQIYYQGQPVSFIYRGGTCIYPGNPVDPTKYVLVYNPTYRITGSSFNRSDYLPTEYITTHIISTDSKYPIYAWNDTSGRWYCDSDVVYTGSTIIIDQVANFEGIDTLNTHNLTIFPSIPELRPEYIAKINGSWDLTNLTAFHTYVLGRNTKFDISLCASSVNIVEIPSQAFNSSTPTDIDLGFSKYTITGATSFGRISVLIFRNTSYVSRYTVYPQVEVGVRITSLYVPSNLIEEYRADTYWEYLTRYGLTIYPLEGSPYEQPGSL